MVEKVHELDLSDRKMTMTELEQETDISRVFIHKILTDELQLKFVPKFLIAN